MRIARYAPWLLGALLVLRVVACGGGSKQGGGPTGGGAAGVPPGPSGTCVTGPAIQYTSAGQTETHSCGNYFCTVDAATGSASCPSGAGVKPFRTCRSASDCMGATYCGAFGDSFSIHLGSPMCVDSVCDWATETQQSCTGGQLCYPSDCATIASGTTSGGFPWTGQGGTCGANGCSGAGGQGGASGGQSGTTGKGGAGGSGGKGASGGQSGATGKGGAGGSGAATSGTCVNGDVSYTSNGQTQIHACSKHDCWIDVATGSAACATPDPAASVPFRTCRLTADCAGITYCAPQGGNYEYLPGNPSCLDSVCDWATYSSRQCPAGYVCYPTGCSMGLWDGGIVTGSGGFGGTTSGGFPWDAGSGGSGGVSGTTSGGFPWDATTGN